DDLLMFELSGQIENPAFGFKTPFSRDVLLEAAVGLDRGKRKIVVRGTLQLGKNPTCFRVTPEGDIFDSKPEIGDLVSRIVLVDVFEGVRSFVMPIQLRQQRRII